MTDVAALKAALQTIPEQLADLPHQAISDGWQQALASLNSLMTGSNSTYLPEAQALLNVCGQHAQDLEAGTERLRIIIDRITASM